MGGKKKKKNYEVVINIDPEDCLTTKQAAELMKIHERKVRMKCEYGILPFVFCPIPTGGKRILINRKAALLHNHLRKQRAPHDKRIKFRD